MTRRMEKEHMFGNQEIDIKDNSKMIIGMGMAKCTGEMAQVLKGNG